MCYLSITLCDGSYYEKRFATKLLKESFLANLEVFDGLFFEMETDAAFLRINPKFIVKIEEKRSELEKNSRMNY